MDGISTLHLKWRSFREIIGHPQSDSQIAEGIFGSNDPAVRFSKLIYGDSGCSVEVATALCDTINRRIDLYRKARTLPDTGAVITPTDISGPVYEFTSKLIGAIGGPIERATLERAHDALLNGIAAVPNIAHPPQLLIERVSTGRMFESVLPSGENQTIVFEAGKHKGRLAISGLQRDPVAAYAVFTRDPTPVGRFVWDLKWSETVGWLPSPFKPERKGDIHLLMDTKPIKPLAGRYIVTAVVVFEAELIAKLDPRGETPPPGALDENDTARFMTNARRLARRRPAAVVLLSNEYAVMA